MKKFTKKEDRPEEETEEKEERKVQEEKGAQGIEPEKGEARYRIKYFITVLDILDIESYPGREGGSGD